MCRVSRAVRNLHSLLSVLSFCVPVLSGCVSYICTVYYLCCRVVFHTFAQFITCVVWLCFNLLYVLSDCFSYNLHSLLSVCGCVSYNLYSLSVLPGCVSYNLQFITCVA